MKELSYHSADNGNCRVYYKSDKRLYCWQSDSPGEFTLYTCSQDGEPSCPVRKDLDVYTEIPKGDEAIERELTEFLQRPQVWVG